MNYILGIDQGTSGTKALLFDRQGKPVAKGSAALKTSYHDNGHVEQDPEDIFQNVLSAVTKCVESLKAAGGQLSHIEACGISNQRETFLLWDESGTPLYNAIVWQCKRSIGICNRWKTAGLGTEIKDRTGLLIDPYFSGSKLVWLYENDATIKGKIDAGEAYFGTVDTWLLYRLTNGNGYFTDYTNASRTLFFNLKQLAWDQSLLRTFNLTNLRLPEPKPSSWSFGETDFHGLLPAPIRITGMIGDSHAAAFGEGCFAPGEAKATLGTGCSILMNTGKDCIESTNGMVSTICWSTEGTVQYALEGVIVTCGATLEWLKNELGLFADSRATEEMARSVKDNGGVYLVPAFSGLGAPHWQMDRKASITGLTFGSKKEHLVRAALESIPYQIKDVIMAMESDTAMSLSRLMVDGGISANGFVTQFLADLLQKEVVTIGQPDISALGAAYMAGLTNGLYPDIDYIKALNSNKTLVTPTNHELTKKYYEGWKGSLLATT
ncbi:MAG: glycerol kinase GlpK [Bacteroidetes bacterium]|nr:glycerol kinase GlpK [Bacteroidota bacterium]